MPASSSIGKRLVSLDQFRGYIVAGMCVANFFAPFASIPAVLKHNETYFSYADSIMPGFLFCVGFSFRLTYLRRRRQWTRRQTARTYMRRCAILLALSLGTYLFTGRIDQWFDVRAMPPEYQSQREKAPRTRSFDVLVDAARNTLRDDSPRAVIEYAAKLGDALNDADRDAPAGERLHGIAQEAERRALDEGRPFVAAATKRLKQWETFTWPHKLLIHWRIRGGKLLKSAMWETLAIIAVTQLLVLPWIGFPSWFRLALLAALGAAHAALCYWFNWDFVHGLYDNWLSRQWMTGDDVSWDGGVFGPLGWSVVMLAGTLAHDVVLRAATPRVAATRLILWGAVFMALGYSMSCLSRLYDLAPSEVAAMRVRRLQDEAERQWLDNVIVRWQKRLAQLGWALEQPEANEDAILDEARRVTATIAVLREQQRAAPRRIMAPSAVLPPWERAQGRSVAEWLAEPPFVGPPADDPRFAAPPHVEHRLRNYWMMSKRLPTLSFLTFACGWSMAVYALFAACCDAAGLEVGVFRTFGTNALAAYFIHAALALGIGALLPSNAPLGACLAGFGAFFLLTYAIVRLLEKRRLFLRL